MMLRGPVASKNIQSVFKRLSSSQIAKQDAGDGQVMKTKLKNGISVVTTDNPSLHANVMLFVKAGSRYENSNNFGISHCVRSSALLSTEKDTAWHYTQLLGNLGGDFSASGTREHIAYNLKCGRRVWRDLITEVVAPSVCKNSFLWWELDKISKTMRIQLAQADIDPAFRLMEAVHRASFRGGLGNSILSPESMIGSHTTEMAQEFFASNFTLNNMVLVGSGVNHDELCDVGDTAFDLPSSGSSATKPSEFVSSEVRLQERGTTAHVGISFCGSSLNDQDAIAIAVLQNILGTNSSVKRQSGKIGRIGAAIGKKVDGSFVTSSYNVNYADAGLIGVYIKADSANIGSAVSAVREEIGALAGGSVSDKEVAAGKQNLKSSILMQTECSEYAVGDLGVQTSLLGGAASPQEIVSKIDAITTSQVARVAKKVLGGKKSIAAVGNLDNCPYLADL